MMQNRILQCCVRFWRYNRSLAVHWILGSTLEVRSSAMRRLVPALLFVSLTGLAFGQGHPGGSWSLNGLGPVVYPVMGHTPTATSPIGQFAGGGFSHGFVNPGHAAHPQHGSTVIVPYPVYYGGYYGYDPSAAGYANGGAPAPGYGDDGSQYGAGLPSVVINQNFVPPQAN